MNTQIRRKTALLLTGEVWMEAQISYNISVSQNLVQSSALTLCHSLETESEVRTLLEAHLCQNSWFLLCIEKSIHKH